MRRGAYLAWRRRGSLAPRDLAWPTRSTIDSSASFLSSPFSSSASSSWTSREDERTAFESTVGNTRLVRLKGPSEITGCHIFGKAEYENPGGSIKDRAACWMIADAHRRGELIRGKKCAIVEGTAGNTGIGLALAGRQYGYDVIIVLAETQSDEKKEALRQAGAKLIEVPAVPYKDPRNYVHVAERLAEQLQQNNVYDKTWYANQWDNLANRQAHIDSTGPEIWEQTNGKIDVFSCATGTGGTITGVAEFLRAKSKGKVKIALTDPEGAVVLRFLRDGVMEAVGSSISEGIGQGRITGNMGAGNFRPDLYFEVKDIDMLPVLYRLQQEEGLAVGGSAGVNVQGAIKVGKEIGPGHTIVTMLCDRADRYATKLYNPEFLHAKGLPVPPWLENETDRESARRHEAFDKALHSALRTGQISKQMSFG